MPKTNDVLWVIYRDDNPRPRAGTGSDLPDLGRVVQFAKMCLQAYKRKTGITPSQLGVTSAFPLNAEAQIVETGVRVIRNLPAWSHEEVWVGGEVIDG